MEKEQEQKPLDENDSLDKSTEDANPEDQTDTKFDSKKRKKKKKKLLRKK